VTSGWSLFIKKSKHILGSVTFFSENRAVYEIMWEKYGRAGQTTDDSIQLRRKDAHDMRDN